MTTLDNCSICFEDITETTGRTVLSCKHAFHLRCVVTWLQREEGAGTCPCCRAEPGEMEQISRSSTDGDSEGSGSEDEESVEGVTDLMRAAEDNDLDEIRRLMNAGENPETIDSEGYTALAHAVQTYNIEATELLIELGADVLSLSLLCPDNEDETISPEMALHGACHYADVTCMRYLLDSGVSVHCEAAGDGASPLTTVIRSGEDEESIEDAVRLLMKRGADPYSIDPTGWNTLMWFANYEVNSQYIMKLLVPPRPSIAMVAAAARLIQTTWRYRQAIKEEKQCISILAGLKFTIVNEQPVDNWFMSRMLQVV